MSAFKEKARTQFDVRFGNRANGVGSALIEQNDPIPTNETGRPVHPCRVLLTAPPQTGLAM